MAMHREVTGISCACNALCGFTDSYKLADLQLLAALTLHSNTDYSVVQV